MDFDMFGKLRIGIPIIGVKEWLGGVTYVELLVKALNILPEEERPKIFLIVDESKLSALDLHKHIFPLLDGYIFLGDNYHPAASFLQHPLTHCRSYAELANHIDFYYPVNSDVVPEVCSGSWIPDFQHIHLPEFFPKEELARRDGWFRKIAEKAKLVVFSSKDSENDFRRLFPKSSAVTRVLHFYALPLDEWYETDPVKFQKKYNLPDKFFICCNQFWVHKNHNRLFEALSKVRQKGSDVDLVCTGSVAEWRVRDYFHNLMNLINSLNINDRVHILGTIPRNDQIQLIRRSLAVIQPSLFEGWSTVVEDSRVLGKTMILSDLVVHYEQAPDHAFYFDRNNSDDLAEKIINLLPTLKPGPDTSREQEAQTKAHEIVRNYAKEFCTIALEAQKLFKRVTNKKSFVRAYQESSNTASTITVATSIAPKNVEHQKAAVASWLKLGLKVISVNTAVEINLLKDYFPDVTFFEASRNAAKITGKPYIFLDDILKALNDCESEICGIVNSDIHLIADSTFLEFIYTQAKDSFLYGTRIEIESLDSLNGEEYIWGFDYFFFDRSVIHLYPNSNFSIGAPWWDLWACFIPAIKNFSVKKLETHVAYHKTHPKNWSQHAWMIFFKEFISHLSDKDIASYLSGDVLEKVKFYMKQGKFVEFSQYIVLFINQKAEKITVDDSQLCISSSKAFAVSDKVHNSRISCQSGGFYPKISIITPSFNQGQFLEECIDSVLNQNYPNLEYIIMDGGSTDNSVEIIKKYEKYLTYWQSKPDNGQYDAINEGFRRATGEIMAWLNSDDKYHPNAFLKVAYIFEAFRHVHWIIGRPSWWDENGRLSCVAYYHPPWSRERYLTKNYHNPFIQQESTFWRRSLWEKAGGTLRTDLMLAGDLELWIRFFRYTPLYSVATLIGGYRFYGTQKAKLFMDKYMLEAEKILDEEIAFYHNNREKTLLPAPPVLTLPWETFLSDANAIDAESVRKKKCWHTYLDNLAALMETADSEGQIDAAHFLKTELTAFQDILSDKELHSSQ